MAIFLACNTTFSYTPLVRADFAPLPPGSVGAWQTPTKGPPPQNATACEGKIYYEFRSVEATREKVGFDTFITTTATTSCSGAPITPS